MESTNKFLQILLNFSACKTRSGKTLRCQCERWCPDQEQLSARRDKLSDNASVTDKTPVRLDPLGYLEILEWMAIQAPPESLAKMDTAAICRL